MSNVMFVWIGSGRTGRNGVGSKGRLLDEAARARLPVPDGAVVLDAFYRFACQEGLVAVQDGHLEIPDPPYLSNTLYHGAHLPRFNRPVIIRPAFSSENSSPSDVAEYSPTIAHEDTKAQMVDANDPTAFALALGRIWSATAPLDDTWRRDTLVMEMVQSVTQLTHGTAVTGDAGEIDLVAHHTVAHQTVDHHMVHHHPNPTTSVAWQLPRLNRWQRPDDAFPPFARRLQQLLRGVRRTFGRGSWNLEWADDGEICWLITIYPDPTPIET